MHLLLAIFSQISQQHFLLAQVLLITYKQNTDLQSLHSPQFNVSQPSYQYSPIANTSIMLRPLFSPSPANTNYPAFSYSPPPNTLTHYFPKEITISNLPKANIQEAEDSAFVSPTSKKKIKVPALCLNSIKN